LAREIAKPLSYNLNFRLVAKNKRKSRKTQFMRKFLTSILERLAEKVREKEPPVTILEADKEDNTSQTKARKVPKKKKQKEKKYTEEAISMKETLPSISPQKMKLISIAGDIRLDPDKTESAFMARQLVQATLPHKNPGNVQAWSRKNGDLTMTIRPGWDEKKEKTIGFPYGAIPRLLLFWITTEAIRNKNPRIELGNNLAQFMDTLGLNSRGGGKRSDVKRLQNQMIRLFQSSISFNQSSGGKKTWINMHVAPKGMLWWDEKKPNQGTLFENWIQLGEDFFNAITSAPVPADMRILKALKRSPLALDLYVWTTYTAYQTQQNGQSRSLSWEILHEQFGAEYSDTKNFAKKAWNALRKIQAFYPELNIERVKGGINVLPSKPSITIKPKKTKTPSI
jgi:hypothetical protein